MLMATARAKQPHRRRPMICVAHTHARLKLYSIRTAFDAGNLAYGSDSDVADFGSEHDQSPSCVHAAGSVSHRRIGERASHAT